MTPKLQQALKNVKRASRRKLNSKNCRRFMKWTLAFHRLNNKSPRRKENLEVFLDSVTKASLKFFL